MQGNALPAAQERDNRKYLLAVLAASFGALAICCAFNLTVDPYALVGDARHRSLPLDLTFEREIRFNVIAARHPKTLFMGSSQVAAGFDPHNPIVPDRDAFNAAIDGGTFSETLRLLKVAEKMTAVSEIILGVSYNMTAHEGADRTNDLFLRDKTDLLDKLQAFTSLTMLESSLKAVADKLAGNGSDMLPDGQLNNQVMQRQQRGHGGVHGAFAALSHPATGDVTAFLSDLRRFVATACAQHTRVTIALLPDHATELELFAASGQWAKLKDWKKGIVRVDSQAPCPVRTVDFEDYNEVTTEPLPAAGDQSMRYYWDPGHFTTATGDLVLARLYASSSYEKPSSDGFGTELTPANVGQALKRMDDGRRNYELSHRRSVAQANAVTKPRR